MFRGSVKGTGYPLHSPVSPLHFPSRATPCAITFQLDSAIDIFSFNSYASRRVGQIDALGKYVNGGCKGIWPDKQQR